MRYNGKIMSLTRQIARNTLVQLIGRLISVALALVVVVIMTRALGPEGFGGYSTIIAFLQFFGIVVDFGLTLTANRMLGALSSSVSSQANQQRDHAKLTPSRLMSNLMTLRFFSAVIFLGLAPIVALAFPYPTAVKQGMFLTSLSFLAIIMGQTLVPVFQKELKMGAVAIAELAGRIALLAGVILAAYFKTNLLWFMAAIVAGSATQYLYLRCAVSKFIKLHFVFDWPLWRRIIRTSWPIGLSVIFNLIYLKADIIILSVLRSQSEVGFYGAAYRVLDQFTALATMFMGLVLPPLTAAWIASDRGRFARIFQRAFDAFALLAWPLLISALIIGRPLMVFVAGPDFALAGDILRILMIAMACVFFSTLFGHVVVVINKQKAMIWGYIITAVLALGAYGLAIPHYGIWGAAWATVFSEILILVATFIMVWKNTRFKPSLVLFSKSLLSSIIMGLALYALRGYHVLILIFSAMLIYALAIYALRGVRKELIRDIVFSRPS